MNEVPDLRTLKGLAAVLNELAERHPSAKVAFQGSQYRHYVRDNWPTVEFPTNSIGDMCGSPTIVVDVS